MAIRVRAVEPDAIGAQGIAVPRYDRSALAPRILHLGVGGFHRSHMALYTDELATDGGDWPSAASVCWRLTGTWLRASATRPPLTLIERDSDGASVRVIGSIVDYVLGNGSVEKFAQLLADPNLRSSR